MGTGSKWIVEKRRFGLHLQTAGEEKRVTIEGDPPRRAIVQTRASVVEGPELVPPKLLGRGHRGQS